MPAPASRARARGRARGSAQSAPFVALRLVPGAPLLSRLPGTVRNVNPAAVGVAAVIAFKNQLIVSEVVANIFGDLFVRDARHLAVGCRAVAGVRRPGAADRLVERAAAKAGGDPDGLSEMFAHRLEDVDAQRLEALKRGAPGVVAGG